MFFSRLYANFLTGPIPSTLEMLHETLVLMYKIHKHSSFIHQLLMNVFYRDVHSNCLTGTLSSDIAFENISYVSLSSNFLVGNISDPLPPPSNGLTDYRFNYFESCNDLCCLTGSTCTSQCVNSSTSQSKSPLPLGIERSEWTELNVTLLGQKKRIIQIETHFSSAPYLLKSYACPNVFDVTPCLNVRVNSSVNVSSGVTSLEKDIPYSNSQTTSTYQSFFYHIKGDVCSTSVKVMFH